MPPKKEHITDEERAKRIRETAREHETSNDPQDLERTFSKIITTPPHNPKSGEKPKA